MTHPEPVSRCAREDPLPKGESGCFGEAAARLCGVASLLVGWRPDEFWDATPAELALAMTAGTSADAPDSKTIEALRLRFPDEALGPTPSKDP
jgi:uncharacterized phage protein (TIGR02216 family)